MSLENVTTNLEKLHIDKPLASSSKKMKIPRINIYIYDIDITYSIPETMTLKEFYSSNYFINDALDENFSINVPKERLYIYKIKPETKTESESEVWFLPNIECQVSNLIELFHDKEWILTLKKGDYDTIGLMKIY
jgi:hypothetical protein